MDAKKRDFASFLDERRGTPDDDGDLLANEADDVSVGAPTIPFDYLAVAEELHSGRIKLQQDRRKGGPRVVPDLEAGYRAELEAYLDAAKIEAEPSRAWQSDGGHSEPELSIKPDDIAVELGLDRLPPSEYAKLRRRFAFENHPDRVAPQLRDRAMVRMKIANMLIDAATGKDKTRNR